MLKSQLRQHLIKNDVQILIFSFYLAIFFDKIVMTPEYLHNFHFILSFGAL